LLFVILFSIYLLIGYPTFPTSVAQIKDNFSHQIKLGLDLQGGTHLILQVQVQDAIAQETDQMVDRLNKQLRDKKIRSTKFAASMTRISLCAMSIQRRVRHFVILLRNSTETIGMLRAPRAS